VYTVVQPQIPLIAYLSDMITIHHQIDGQTDVILVATTDFSVV